MLILEITGNPIPQKRPRFSTRNGNVVTYNSQKELKEQTQWQLKAQYRNEPLKFPVSVDLNFFMPIPKSTSKHLRRQMICGQYHHIKKPDLDNLEKFILDCLTGIVIIDDAQIVSKESRKMYAENPGTLIAIRSCLDLLQEIESGC